MKKSLKGKIKEVISDELIKQLNEPQTYIVSSEYSSLLINNYNDEYCFYIYPFKAFKYQFWYNYKVSYGTKIMSYEEIYSFYIASPFHPLHKTINKLMVNKKVKMRDINRLISRLPKYLADKLKEM